MSSYSYQDLSTRLAQVERMVEFVMKTINITSQYRSPIMPEHVVTETKSLFDLYRAASRAGIDIMSREEALANGLDPEKAETISAPLGASTLEPSANPSA